MKTRKTAIRRPPIVPVGPSIAYIPLTQGLFALVDSEDAGWLGRYNWSAMYGNSVRTFYAVRTSVSTEGRRKLLGMHVEIVGPRPGFVPDHIYGNTLDNRRSQLREASHSQNLFNRKLALPVSNTSGHVGVRQRTPNCWEARVGVRGKTIRKYARTQAAALEIRKNLEQAHFGDFAHMGDRDE